MLADSATELFAARTMLYEVARSIDAGHDRKTLHGQASMAKLYCSEMAGRVADRAVQIFGGRGYMRENVAERMFRELRVERIWEGASEIQRIIVARQLMTRGPAALLDPVVTSSRRTNPTGSAKPLSATVSRRFGTAARTSRTAGSSATARDSTMSPPVLSPCRRAAMFTVEPK